MKKILVSNCLLLLLVTTFATGCSRKMDVPGTAVTLEASDNVKSAELYDPAVREAMAWAKKASTLEGQGKYEEAAFCLNQAHAKHPNQDPRPESSRKLPWTDADRAYGSRKATLYLRMRKPELAIGWLDRLGGAQSSTDKHYRATALFMQKDYDQASKLLEGKPSLLAGAILMAQGKEAEGKEMIKKEWTKTKAQWQSSLQNERERRSIIRYTWWMEFPDELQKTIEQIDPNAMSF